MTLSYRDDVAIAQLAYYVPACCAATYLCFRHGFSKAASWYFLVAFSLLRIVAAICQLIYSHDPSKPAATALAICTSVGLSPLVLLCLGLLSRANDFLAKPRLPKLVFKSLDLLSLVGLIVGIVGGVGASKSADRTNVDAKSKAAVVIFLAVFFFDLLILAYLALAVSRLAAGERRILVGVAASCPFIFVRLLYALIFDLGGDQNFNSLTGNPTIYLCMSVIMEFIGVMICLILGFSLRKGTKHKPVEAEKPPG